MHSQLAFCGPIALTVAAHRPERVSLVCVWPAAVVTPGVQPEEGTPASALISPPSAAASCAAMRRLVQLLTVLALLHASIAQPSAAAPPAAAAAAGSIISSKDAVDTSAPIDVELIFSGECWMLATPEER